MHTIRITVNEKLFIRAKRAQKTRAKKIEIIYFKKDDWVLVRNEEKQKFEANWFGPYKIIKESPLNTYAL